MTTATVKNTMLYCPKCQQTYEDASQRFCLTDGRRLLPVASADKPSAGAGGVFTSILNRKAETETDKFSSAPRFSKSDRTQFTRPTFQPPAGKMFKAEPDPEDDFQPRVESEPIIFEPVSPLVEPEIQTSYVDENIAFENFTEPEYEPEEIETAETEFAAETPIAAPVSPPVDDKLETAAIKPAGRVLPPLPDEEELEFVGVKTTGDLPWQKRSIEPPNESSPRRNWLSAASVAILLVGLLGVWYYFLNRPAQTVIVPTETEATNPAEQPAQNQTPVETIVNPAPTAEEIETPPIARSITQPPDTIYFENGKENLKGDALKNYLGFSLYYPKDWTHKESKNNFLDVSKSDGRGLPVEQMLVSYYNSKGTFKADTENFQRQVKETNDTLKKIIPSYKMVSEGEITVNNGWQAYEVKFQGTGKAANGDKITLWGRRLFIPTAIRGTKNGFVITMLATSLSEQVKGVDDVGVNGELAGVLETFEPNQKF